MDLKSQALYLVSQVIREALPGAAVKRALQSIEFDPAGQIYLVSVGKAGYEMGKSTCTLLGSRITAGMIITKYGHAKDAPVGVRVFEAGHPVPDENGFHATEEVLRLVSGLTAHDSVLFLLSGGGSALFESPLIPPSELADITRQLLASGADIVEINTIRKRLSSVKGGRFALRCMPAHVYSIILSDIIGDPLDMIASGPAYPDFSTSADAIAIAKRLHLSLSPFAWQCLEQETPKTLTNVSTYVTGSVKALCASAERVCQELGYDVLTLTSSLNCEAREAGRFLSAIARDHQDSSKSLAFLAGGETVVHLTGHGLGGRNQELVLSAAEGLSSCRNTCIFSFGSDGTDGPTDAAGGIVDETTKDKLSSCGFSIYDVLQNNDAYHALQAVDSLLLTGPTGTNVNDLSVILINR